MNRKTIKNNNDAAKAGRETKKQTDRRGETDGQIVRLTDKKCKDNLKQKQAGVQRSKQADKQTDRYYKTASK